MNMISNIYTPEKLQNIAKQAVVAALLIGILWCGKRRSTGVQPEIMRSVEYREDEHDSLYDTEYENDAPYDWDDECIVLSRQERDTSLRNTKKIAPNTLSPKKQ